MRKTAEPCLFFVWLSGAFAGVGFVTVPLSLARGWNEWLTVVVVLTAAGSALAYWGGWRV